MERLTERKTSCWIKTKSGKDYTNYTQDWDAISKLADYEDTGLTLEQIRELKERDTAKAAIIIGDNRAIGCKVGNCPTCGAMTRDYLEFCSDCGQRIKWED